MTDIAAENRELHNQWENSCDLLNDSEGKREALAQENERLQAENNSLRDSVDAVRAEYLQRYMNATSRISELEAERTTAIADALVANMRVIELEAERDGIAEALDMQDTDEDMRTRIIETIDYIGS